MSEIAPTQRMWQTMVRVDAFSNDNYLLVTIPAWNPNKQIQMHTANVDNDYIRKQCLAPGYRCLVMVNIGATNVKDLVIEDWTIG